METVCLCTEWCCCTSLQPARRPTTFNQAGAQPPHEGRLADASGGERPEAFQLDRQEARGNVHAAFDVPVRRCRYSSQIAASSHGFGLVPELTGAQGRRSARIDLHRDQACSDRFSVLDKLVYTGVVGNVQLELSLQGLRRDRAACLQVFVNTSATHVLAVMSGEVVPVNWSVLQTGEGLWL